MHDLVATTLLVALSFQALSMGFVSAERKFPFFARQSGLDLSGFALVIIALFVATVCLGGILYPSYRIAVRPYLKMHDLRAANGAFEIKEHFAALGLMMLPAYWAAWRMPAQAGAARAVLTWILTGMVWWNFLVGHVMNYITGLFS